VIKIPNERYWQVPTKVVSVKCPIAAAEGFALFIQSEIRKQINPDGSVNRGRPTQTDIKTSIINAIQSVTEFFMICLDQDMWGDAFSDFATVQGAGEAISQLQQYITEIDKK
jgi:hypothetical protein